MNSREMSNLEEEGEEEEEMEEEEEEELSERKRTMRVHIISTVSSAQHTKRL